MGFEIFFQIDWLMARLSFEGPPGMGFEILLRLKLVRGKIEL